MQIQVTKNKVILPDNYIVNKGEYHINVLEFSFSEEYTDDLVKKAIFVSDEVAIEQAIINNTCHIPNEVLNVKSFELRVYAYEVENGELILRYSPTYATIYLREGSYRGNTGSGEVITPTQFEQYEQALNEGLQEIEEGLEGAENVDIDANKSGAVATITITDRNGTEKTVQIYDGEDVGTDDYTDLNNKPSINNVTLIGNKTSSDLGLQPEGNYIVDNNYVHTDNNFNDTYKSNVDSNTSSRHTHSNKSVLDSISSSDITNWNNKSDFNGSYNDLTNKPTIPNKTSDLNNDSGFINKNANDLTNYYKTSETYNKTEIDNKISSVYRYKGTVATYANLPSISLTIGDVYNVESTGDNYAWTGTVWDKLGGDIDLSGYQSKIDNSHKLNADLVDDTSTTNKFTSTSEKNSWNAKYDKPSGGIPSTDMSSSVQTSLGKADTAIQDVSDKEDKSNKVTSLSSSSTDTQYPSAKCVYDLIGDIETLLSEV